MRTVLTNVESGDRNGCSGLLHDPSSDSDEQPADSQAGMALIAVAAGYTHSLALKSDGTVVAWGVVCQS